MCDSPVNWIAWLDGELPSEEAEQARRHLEFCSECRGGLEDYRQATVEFSAFCDERLASATQRDAPRWTAVVAAAGAVAAVAALLLIAYHPHVVRHPVLGPQEVADSPAPLASAEPLPLPVHRVERPRRKQRVVAAPHQVQDASNRPNWNENAYSRPYEPVIEISIPAEEMFPPGAVPPGMGFAADLAIAADGSPDRLRLQPRLVGFERRTSIP